MEADIQLLESYIVRLILG